jgi:hypothetical protein
MQYHYLGAGRIAMLAVLMAAFSLLELFNLLLSSSNMACELRIASCDAALRIAIALRQHF